MIGQGTTIGDLRVEALERTTTGGSVYQAVQAGLGRTVSLHVPDATPESEAGRRFLADAARLATIDHPHVLPVYEVRSVDGRIVAVARAPAGRRAQDVLREGPLPASAAVSVIEQLVSATRELERAGVRGVVPTLANVVLAGLPEAPTAELAALEALLETEDHDDTGDAGGPAAFGHMLAALTTGSADAPTARIPAPLRPVVERATRPGGYASAADVAEAAREVVPAAPRRSLRRRSVLAAVAVAAVAAVAVAVVARSRGGDDAQRPAAAAPSAPAARIAAAIPVGGTPRSVAVGEGAVWVGRQDRQLVRVDPRTNRVTGTPVRFGHDIPQDSNVNVLAGAGAVWAMHGPGGTVFRIDPETLRITGRIRVGGYLFGGTLSGRELWILRIPDVNGPAPQATLVRYDTRTLRPIGEPIPDMGYQPADVEADGPIAYASDVALGRVTRVDTRTGAKQTVRVGTRVIDSTLNGGTLWAPDFFGQFVGRIDARTLALSDDVTRGISFPLSTVRDAHGLWVLSLREPDPTGPARLQHVDLATGRLVGRPLDVGAGVGFIRAGAGALWIASEQRGLLKVVAADPMPAPRAPEPAPRQPFPLRPGPLPAGVHAGRVGGIGFTLRVDRGWLGTAVEPGLVEFGRSEDPDRSLALMHPEQVFDARTKVHRFTRPGQVLGLLRRNPHAILGPVEHRTIGGAPAVGLVVNVRAFKNYNDVCSRPCITMFGFEGITWSVERGVPEQIWLQRRAGKLIAYLESTAGTPDFAPTTALLDTLAFR